MRPGGSICSVMLRAGRPRRAGAARENTALWRGVYHYPQDVQESVRFSLLLIQEGNTLAGYTREPNTFGTRGEPWLHATIKGAVDKQTGEITFTKTYDGTAGQNHDVHYKGKIAGGALDGAWSMGDVPGGQFTLGKTNTRSGPLAGVWTGIYQYPEGSGKEPVRFNLIMVHDSQGLTGAIKETNTFGNPGEPWLAAKIKGTFDAKSGKVAIVKTYDGTGGEEHEVEYSGSLSQDSKHLDGTWKLDENVSGRFTLERLPLTEKTLNDLR